MVPYTTIYSSPETMFEDVKALGNWSDLTFVAISELNRAVWRLLLPFPAVVLGRGHSVFSREHVVFASIEQMDKIKESYDKQTFYFLDISNDYSEEQCNLL